MDLALKIIVEALICFPLASLGSNWGQLSASLGNLGSPQSSIFDALPCLGNIFCDLGPPRRLPNRFSENFDQNASRLSQNIIKFSIPGLFVGCTNFSPFRTHFYRIAIFLLLKASKPPSLQAPRRVTRSANNPPAHPEDERRRAGSCPLDPYPP